MHRNKNKPQNGLGNGEKIIPISLVNRALEELTSRATAGAQKQRKTKLDRLCNAVMDRNGKCGTIVRAMLETGISIKEVFETPKLEIKQLLNEGSMYAGFFVVIRTLVFLRFTAAFIIVF